FSTASPIKGIIYCNICGSVFYYSTSGWIKYVEYNSKFNIMPKETEETIEVERECCQKEDLVEIPLVLKNLPGSPCMLSYKHNRMCKWCGRINQYTNALVNDIVPMVLKTDFFVEVNVAFGTKSDTLKNDNEEA
nr:hypothetical protein [Dehalococcoidales bacterium]